MNSQEQQGLSDRIHSAEMLRVTRLIGNVIHDINNPLDVILGNAEFIQESKEFQESSAAILKAVGRASELLKALQLVYRYPSGKTPECVSVKKLMDAVLAASRALFKGRSLVPRLEGISEDLALVCHPGAIARVVLELIRNAVEAIESSSQSWVAISARATENTIEIRVANSGVSIGNAPGDELRIFEPFFTTKDPAKHVGLGLSQARQDVQNSAGTLELEGTEDCTVFVLRLPKAGR